jgi:hypothetical protein
MTTRNKITEQIMRLYMRSFDRENIKPNVDKREIALLVDQCVNTLLALEVQQQAQLGIVDVPTCMIATYTGQTVSGSGGGPFTVPLPAYPIKLPMDMGVWSISPEPAAPAYIPIKTDFWDLLSEEDEGLLEDQIGFYVDGRTVTFTDQPSSTVKIKLLIVDPATLNEFDPYPIPADVEKKVVENVLQELTSRGLAPEKPKG